MGNYSSRLRTYTVTVAAGASVSSYVDIQGTPVVGVICPVGVSNTSAYFESSQDRTTFTPAYNSFGDRLDFTLGSNMHTLFTPHDLVGMRFIRLQFKNTERDAQTITIIGRADG